MQDIEFCKNRYSHAICKPIALQFLSENDIAMLELVVDDSEDVVHLSIADERHYKLVGKNEITDEELRWIGINE